MCNQVWLAIIPMQMILISLSFWFIVEGAQVIVSCCMAYRWGHQLWWSGHLEIGNESHSPKTMIQRFCGFRILLNATEWNNFERLNSSNYHIPSRFLALFSSIILRYIHVLQYYSIPDVLESLKHRFTSWSVNQCNKAWWRVQFMDPKYSSVVDLIYDCVSNLGCNQVVHFSLISFFISRKYLK